MGAYLGLYPKKAILVSCGPHLSCFLHPQDEKSSKG